MTASKDYNPPTSAAMRARQNEADALRLLIAQRRLYRKAKRWLALRWFGMVVIGIGAPLLALLKPSLAVVASAVAGAWLFFGRTLLLHWQTALTSQAAAVQEQFDLFIFAMPEIANRSDVPSLEEVAAIAGPDDLLRTVAEGEGLIDWYPIESDDGTIAVAIAQRANASYSNRLIKSTARLWALVVAVWTGALSIMSAVAGLSFAQILLGVVFPVLPAFLDVVQYVASVRRSSTEKAGLAGVIQDHLGGTRGPVKPEDLLVWQAQLFDLRRSAPEVPEIVYKLARKKNERTMKSAARQLSEKSKRRQS